MTLRADALKELPLFADLSGKDREFIAKHMDEVSFDQGAALINQDEPNDKFFVLTQGEVDVIVSGQPRQKLGAGSFFGEISMQRGVSATATIVASTPAQAYVMTREQFTALGTSADVRSRLQVTIGDRLAHDRMVLSWQRT